MRTKIALAALLLLTASVHAATLSENIKRVEQGAADEKEALELKEAIKQLSAAGAPSVEPLMQILANAKTNLQITTVTGIIASLEQPEAAQALTKYAPDFMKMLQSENIGIKYNAIKILGNIQYQKAVPELEKLASHKEESIRTIVADSLGRMGDRSSLPALLTLLADDEKNIRIHAIRALAAVGSAVGTGKENPPVDVVNELIKILKDGDANERTAVVEALAKIIGYEIDKHEKWMFSHTPDKREPIIDEMQVWWRAAKGKTRYPLADKEMELRVNLMLDSGEKKEVRVAALKALTRIADRSTVRYLVYVMRHDVPELREIAAPVASKLAGITIKFDKSASNMRWIDDVNDFEKRWLEKQK